MGQFRRIAIAGAAILGFGAAAAAQTPAAVDFARDVQPILEARCISCHGPEQQSNNFRLDRRSVVMRRGTTLVPGSSETSRLFLRLVGTEFGSRMPPTGQLPAGEIDVIKRWIDQGASWPDALANELAVPPPDPVAVRWIDSIRKGDTRGVAREIAATPGAVNGRGAGGSTPLMYAVLYGDVPLVERMLKAGANVNVKNDIGATPLMWALDDVDTVRLLLERGADPNAQTEDGTTALMWACGQTGSAAVVRLLLDRGADPSARGGAALTRAAQLGSLDAIRLLLQHGIKANVSAALVAALHARCAECVTLLRQQGNLAPVRAAFGTVLPPQGDGDADAVRLLLDLGADPTFTDSKGRTALMMAASSDSMSPAAIELLLARGADVHARMPSGETALDLARLRGDTPVAATLAKATSRANAALSRTTPLTYKTANTVDGAVRQALPLLQRSALRFSEKAGCVSCHHNSLVQMTLAAARKNGFTVDEGMARREVKTIASTLDEQRERLVLGIVGPAQMDGLPYALVGLAAESFPADASTDSVARGLKNIQQPDGRWLIAVHRPPLESSEIENTALSMRALQLYAPKARREAYDKSIQLAATWLVRAQPATLEDRGFRLLGLTWGTTNKATVQAARRDLISRQRSNGGWAQLPTLEPDAYATGLALVALHESGMAVTDPVYQRGIKYLLDSQLEDGSWFVKSRTLQLQPYFDSLFPHGNDQWISLTATGWATTALAHARGAAAGTK